MSEKHTYKQGNKTDEDKRTLKLNTTGILIILYETDKKKTQNEAKIINVYCRQSLCRVTWSLRGKSPFTEIFVFESLSWHSCECYGCCCACIVWSVPCKKYMNNDINFNFQSFNVIFEDSGNTFALWITMYIKYIAWGMKIFSLIYT